MTAAGCPRVHVHTPPAYCKGRSFAGPSAAPCGSVATDGPAFESDGKLIYKTRARRERANRQT